MIELQEIFEVTYGNKFDLNKMTKTGNLDGINFVSRTANNNGVSATIRAVNKLEPYESGMITVALGGSILSSFVQNKPFYTGQNIAVLKPRNPMNLLQKLFYCKCIHSNAFKFSTFGREANRFLKTLKIPNIHEIPNWVNNFNISQYDNAHYPFSKEMPPTFDTKKWTWFVYEDLFEIKKGKRLTKSKMVKGTTPFIGAIDSNNGHRQHVNITPNHKGGTITVNYNGSVAESFYQSSPYWASDDVNVLYPKFDMNEFSAMFLCALIKTEKYRFNYGRKWHKERMEKSKIKLPVDNDGNPDWQFMESYIKSLPYSSSL